MASPAGGIDIEEVAAKTPEKLLKHPVDPRYGLQPFEAMQLAFFLYSDMKQVRAAAKGIAIDKLVLADIARVAAIPPAPSVAVPSAWHRRSAGRS